MTHPRDQAPVIPAVYDSAQPVLQGPSAVPKSRKHGVFIMVKATKFIVLSAGLLGLIGFFLPLISVQQSGVSGKLSAFQIVKGLDSVQEVVGVQGGAIANTVEGKAAVTEANKALGAVKGIVLALFAPALFLTLFGGIAAAKKRFGRGLGIGSLLFGLVGLGIWALLNSGAEGSAGIGLHMLLLTGVGGTIGGLMGTIKPEPRPELA